MEQELTENLELIRQSSKLLKYAEVRSEISPMYLKKKLDDLSSISSQSLAQRDETVGHLALNFYS